MEEKLVIILNEMAEYLNISQMKILQEVLLKNLQESETISSEITNYDYLEMFIAAKKIEGCSERTVSYYRTTVEHLLKSIDTPIRKITTDEIRGYLAKYQENGRCGKTTVDNIRRNISSFFSWLEEEDYILKSPMKRIHKIKTTQSVKETISDELIERLRDACSCKRDLAMVDLLYSTGMRVPLISLGLSIIFEKMVEGFNLDYLEYYNDKIAKICFSTIVFSWCVVLLAVAWPKMDLMSIEEEIILNRILMWLLTIVGTWFGFGFKCKGRIEKEKKKRNSILKDVDYRKIIGFWLPIVIPLIVCVGILVFVVFFSDQAEKFEKSLFLIALSFTIPGVVMLLLWGRKNNPTKKQSEKDFYKLLKKYKKNKIVEKHFGRNRYHIEDGILVIEKVDILYPNHEMDEEFLLNFSKKEVPFDLEDYEVTLKLLKSRYDSQTDYIQKSILKCVEEMKEKKMKSDC